MTLPALMLAAPLLWEAPIRPLTPPEPLPLGGYTERQGALAEAGGDVLTVRTLVFRSGDRRIALAACEMLTIPESLVREVRARLPDDVTLILAATHTHCAPDSQALNDRMTFAVPGIAAFNRRWLDWYAEEIAAGVRTALEAPAHGASRLEWATPSLPLNRGRRDGAQPDADAGFLRAGDRWLLTTYAAHPTFFEADERRPRGDWPGALMSRSGALALTAAIGDASPKADGTTPVEKIANFVESLVRAEAKADYTTVWEPGDQVAVATVPITLGKPVPHPEFARTYGLPVPLAQVLVNRFAPLSAAVTVLRLGSLVLVGTPAEPTAEIAREIQAAAMRRGFPHSVVLSHVNGWIGYVLAPADYDKGGYEATLSFHGRDAGTRLIEAADAALALVSQEPERARSASGQSR